MTSWWPQLGPSCTLSRCSGQCSADIAQPDPVLHCPLTQFVVYIDGQRTLLDREMRYVFQLYRAMRKQIFEHMRWAKAQISLRICAVWSRPSLFTNRIIGYQNMYEWRANARMILCTCAGWWESAHFTHARRHVFAWHDPIKGFVQWSDTQ